MTFFKDVKAIHRHLFKKEIKITQFLQIWVHSSKALVRGVTDV